MLTQLRWARPAVRLRAGSAICGPGPGDCRLFQDGATAQAVMCLRMTRIEQSCDGWYLFCIPHQIPDVAAWSSRSSTLAAQQSSGEPVVAIPQTPPRHGLRTLLANAEDLYGYPLRELEDCGEAVLVPMSQVAGRVTVLPVLEEHALAANVQQARPRQLLFVLDELH